MAHGFIPVPNVASAELIWSCNGVVTENVLHFQRSAPYSATDLQNLRAMLITWEGNQYNQYRSVQVTLNRVRTKGLDSSGSPMEDYFLPTPHAGGNGQVALPLGTTIAIKLSTGLAGRSQRGRLFYVGLTANLLDTNPQFVSASMVSWIVGALNNLKTTAAANGDTWGVVSYRSGGVWRATGQFTPITTAVAVDRNVDSQRRRLTGRGI